MQYDIVFDDLETAVRKNPNPAMRSLTFRLTIHADSIEAARDVAAEAVNESGMEGNWHVESHNE